MDKYRKHAQSLPLNIRISPGLMDTLREAAGLAQIPLSGWIRDRTARAAKREIHEARRPADSQKMHSKKEDSAMNAPVSTPAQSNRWLARVRGEVSVGLSGDKISAVQMLRGAGGAKHDPASLGDTGKLAKRAHREIEEYLAGERRSFGVPVDLSSLTPFSRDVLRAAERIPYGETRSYGWVAAEAGRPRAVRAVGQALHRNPVPLLIP